MAQVELPHKPDAYEWHRHLQFQNPAFIKHMEGLIAVAKSDTVTSELMTDLVTKVAKQSRVDFDDIMFYLENKGQNVTPPSRSKAKLVISGNARSFAITFSKDVTEKEVRAEFKIFKEYRKKYMPDLKQSRHDAPRDPEFLHSIRQMKQNGASWKKILAAYDSGDLPPTQGENFVEDDLMRYYYNHPY